QLSLVMHLDQYVHAVGERGVLERAPLDVAHRRHDDQDAIGAPGTRFGDLIGLVHEILAQYGKRRGRARGGEEFRHALKRGRVGQHGQTRRAARLEGARQRRRIEIFADQAARRARLLDFGHQRVIAGGEPALERGQKAARRRGNFRGGLDFRKRTRTFRRCDLLALVGFDLGEDVAHDAYALDTAISRSSRPSASALSTDLIAIATPSFRSLALPATTIAAAALSSATSRNGPFLPFNTSISAAALDSASPPRNCSGFDGDSPTSSGLISKVVTLPFSSVATAVGPDVVISSSPSEPCTT